MKYFIVILLAFATVVMADDMMLARKHQSLGYGSVSKFNLNEGTGTAISSANSTNRGTITGAGIKWTNGIVGRGLNFPTADVGQYIVCGKPAITAFPVTLNCWFATKSNSFGVFFNTSYTAGNDSYIYLGNNLARPRIAWRSPGGTEANAIVLDTASATNGNWHMLTGIIYKTNHVAVWYDGIFYASNSASGGNTEFPTLTQTCIGAQYRDTIASPYTGLLDEIEFVNRAWTQDEITMKYNGGFSTQ